MVQSTEQGKDPPSRWARWLDLVASGLRVIFWGGRIALMVTGLAEK